MFRLEVQVRSRSTDICDRLNVLAEVVSHDTGVSIGVVSHDTGVSIGVVSYDTVVTAEVVSHDTSEYERTNMFRGEQTNLWTT